MVSSMISDLMFPQSQPCGCPEEHFSSCPLSPFYCVACFGTRAVWEEDDSIPKGWFKTECERCKGLYEEEA